MERFDAAGVALRERPHHSGRPPRRENTMRSWKKMVVGGAALVISAGAAHAGQAPTAGGQADVAMSSARQETSWNATGGAASDPARTRTDVAATGFGAGYVTHDELDDAFKQVVERVERERNAQSAQPTFTDAG
jgi:hypothetical protein